MNTMTIDTLRGNCTLVAVREVSGRSDQEIIQEFLKNKWKPHHGAYMSTVAKVLIAFGHVVKRVETETSPNSPSVVRRKNGYGETVWCRNSVHYVSLGNFVKNNPKGVFVVATRRHAFVVRDGKVIDPNSRKLLMRGRLTDAFRVEGAAPSRYRIVHVDKDSDPLVQFTHRSFRRRTTMSWLIEREARAFVFQQGGTVKLSLLVKSVKGYSRAFAEWDIERGSLIVVPKIEL